MRTEKNLTKKDIFHRLSTLDISPFVVQKQNLDYISWATVQHILCSLFDDVSYGVSSSDDGQSFHRCGTGGEVHVTLCIDGVCHTEYFPIMDNRMKSKAFDSIDARDVSDSIKRAYVKAAAHFGLGLSLYDKANMPHPARIEHELRPQAERFAEVEEALDLTEFANRAGLRAFFKGLAKDEQEHFKLRVSKLAEGLPE